MNSHLKVAGYGVLDPGSDPIAAAREGFLAARAHYDLPTRAPHLLAVNWEHTRTANRQCVPCTANSCRLQEGSQS